MKQITLKSSFSTLAIALSLLVQAQNSGTSEYGSFFQHTVTSGSVSSNWTDFSHPDLDGNNSAVALYTHNWNPNNAGSGIYCNFPTGLWYSGNPAWAIYAQDWANDTMPYNSVWNILATNAPVGYSYLWSDSASAVSNWMYIDDPNLNGNQNAIFFVSQNYAPHSVYNLSPIGVWYDVFSGKWGVYNQDMAPMDPGAGFNVFLPSPGPNVYTHVADGGNSAFNYTILDHPSLNGDSSKTIIVTQNWNPSDTLGVYNNNEIGVWYTGTNWSIYNEDGATPIPVGAAFNVLVLDQLTGMAEVDEAASLHVYPNPATTEVSVRWNHGDSKDVLLTVADMMGRVMMSVNVTGSVNHTARLDVASLAAGVYSCSIEANGKVATTLLMVE